ncbi:OmcA/MtrC family decaheme c-type cytochrome [Geomonas paludis]|uniref:Cytochrome c n=1 Tax=Geomonas paludis TaxID=2740185 RepID=A0A6V8N1M9_9BACT|nr:OmcA/MtrC family decaheme c-type cytochrome [Geomonas paludis]UPU35173.1 OmcA/MtrC family decaheme c-type cytochrome [Geomonas paludis]GFO66408.1 cytochrome c [Geomonas paludis]
MIGRNLRYLVALLVCVLLPLAGCSGGGSSTKITSKGTEVTVGGKVDVAKAAAKTAFLSSTSAGAVNNVFVYNAQDGAQLGTAAIGSDGSFSGLTFTLPATKTVLVFKAVVAQGTFRSLVPVDLSSPPAAGVITGSNPINIQISQQSTDITRAVSALMGLTGLLGDANQTLASATKTYTDCAQAVVNSGGQILAYSTSGLALSGTLSNGDLLPASAASTLTYDDLNNTQLDGRITSAYIPGNNPIVNFTVVNKATGKGIAGLRTFGLHVAQLKPETAGANSYWLNYILNSTNRPTSDPVTTFNSSTGAVNVQGYTVIDHGDGSYTAIFGSNVKNVSSVPYDASLVHRIGISVRSVAVPGVVGKTAGAYLGPINPQTNANSANFAVRGVANLIYDFTPATGAMLTNNGVQAFARDIVTSAACNQCHDKLGFSGGHFASRPDTKLCVMCHTPQNKLSTDVAGETNGDFTPFIHKIHMGEELSPAETILGVSTAEITYPQDIRNCAMCHKGVDGNNWKTKPSRKACGSCHSSVVWASHEGGQSSDASCAACHTGGIAAVEVSAAHVPVIAPDPNNIFSTPGTGNSRTNAAYVAAAGAVPAGAAKITYEISSVTVAGSPAKAAIKFRMLKDGAPVTFNTYVDATTELLPNFVGSPSLYVVYAVPQDGITAPADFNKSINVYLKDLLNPANTKGTLTGPDGSGYYTATLTAATSTIPAAATMVTGGVGYSYQLGATTQPLTQTNLAAYPYNSGTKVGGLIVAAPNVAKVATNYKARRVIVSNDKCNACHVQLGVAPSFHVGQRNDAPTCAFCHTVNQASSGYSANASTFVHGIHAAAKRSTQFGWHAVDATTGYWEISYPGYLRNCEQCHLAGMYDFSNSVYTSTTSGTYTTATPILDRLLYTTVASGTSTISSTVPPTGVNFSTGTVYGAGFSYAADTDTTTPAAGTTLVTSPITAACFSCHDSSLAKEHMVANGGSIYLDRTTALGRKETCLICHGSAANTLNTTVPTIKAVHRWW